MQDCALDKGLLDEIMDVARVMSADGKPADYIPELALTPPELFALSCAPAGGETRELGLMLYDMDYADESDIKPMFFRARMDNGTIKVPPPESGEIFR